MRLDTVALNSQVARRNWNPPLVASASDSRVAELLVDTATTQGVPGPSAKHQLQLLMLS